MFENEWGRIGQHNLSFRYRLLEILNKKFFVSKGRTDFKFHLGLLQLHLLKEILLFGFYLQNCPELTLFSV